MPCHGLCVQLSSFCSNTIFSWVTPQWAGSCQRESLKHHRNAIPVVQPTLSKHWRKRKSPMATMEKSQLASSFLHIPATSSRAISVGWCGQDSPLHMFISSHLDYCNSLLYCNSDILLRWLKAIQNAAVCLLTGTRRCDHITPVLPMEQYSYMSVDLICSWTPSATNRKHI